MANWPFTIGKLLITSTLKYHSINPPHQYFFCFFFKLRRNGLLLVSFFELRFTVPASKSETPNVTISHLPHSQFSFTQPV